MLDILLLRFDAPLLSFGAPMVDNHGVTQEFPALSMLAGLLGNALGYRHRDADRLSALQARIRFAARRDRAGARLTDYHTVDLGQDFLMAGWTTRGHVEERGGGDAATGTHIRFRDYIADAVYSLALTLAPTEPDPSVSELEQALQEPRRPLFLGRKCCLPASPILLGRTQARSLLEALESLPRLEPSRRDEHEEAQLPAWWPEDEGGDRPSRLIPVTDERDWANQIHSGRRLMRHGLITPLEVSDAR